MKKDDFNLRKKVNKFGILSTYVQETIGPEARKNGLPFTKDRLKQSVFLLIVEGKTDKKFYDNIFNKSNSVIIDLTCGESESEQERKKMNLFGKPAIQILFEKKNHLTDPNSPFSTRVQKNMAIGLIDLDFESYPTSEDINYPNLYQPQQYLHLFSTETNDLETLLLQYGVFEKLLMMIFNKRKKSLGITFDEFRKRVYFRIKLLNHAFRLATKEYGLSWKHVRKISDFCSFVNVPDESVCESIINLVFHSDSKNNADPSIKERFIKKISLDFNDLSALKNQDLHYCRGHNTMMVIQCLMLSLLERRYPEHDLFEIITDDSLKNNRFRKTQLYMSLKKWEDVHFPLKPSRMLIA